MSISCYVVNYDDFNVLGHDALIKPDTTSYFVVGFNADGDLAGVINFKKSSFFGGPASFTFVSVETLPGFKGQGVMTKMLDFFIEYCQDSGIDTLQVTDYTEQGLKFLRNNLLQKCESYGIKVLEECMFSADLLIKQYLD